jgi:hypothetical protein
MEMKAALPSTPTFLWMTPGDFRTSTLKLISNLIFSPQLKIAILQAWPQSLSFFLAIKLFFIVVVTIFPEIVLWLPKVTMH